MWIEIMFTKTLQLYLIFAVCIVSMQSISITSIVRFKNCTHERLNPRQGCMGTFILPNVVLTTSYCAENCHTVGNTKIIRYYVHSFYRNYVQANYIIARNDIALVLIAPEGRKTKLVKLSALDTTSTIGQKALIPVMDEKPRLAITIIEGCYKTQSFGYYVCATNKVTKKSIKVCQERQDQGLPLLLQDRIFGITGISDKCNLAQRSFTAIGPALYWIGATVKELGYKNSVLTTLHDKYSDTTSSCPRADTNFRRNTETVTETESTKTSKLTSTTAIDKPTEKDNVREGIKYQNKVLESMHGFKKWFFSNSEKSHALARGPISNTREPITNMLLRNLKINDSIGLVPILRDLSLVESTTTTEDPNAAITFIPSSTPKRITKPTSTTKKATTTQFTIPFMKVNEQNKTTNVMEWFNAMVKEKLKNNPSMYYVVSSSTTTRRSTIFIDLT